MAFPGTFNFSYYRGDTYEFIVQPKDSLGGEFDLTDFDAEFNIATARGGAIATTASYASGGALGATSFTISSANTAIAAGQKVTGTGIASNTSVTSVSGTTINLSQATTAQVAGTITFSNQFAGTAVVNEATNIITCTITPAIGRNLIGGVSYVYDLQITDGIKIYTILTGTVTVTNDITGAI